ncbi:recombinase family protein [Bacillus cereus]
MKVAIYVRVSTQEQAREGFSIPAQLESLRAFCKSQHWKIVEEYKEEGKSAKSTDRPQIQKMLKDMRNKKFELVLVHKLDRFTRSVSDLYNLLEYMEKYEVNFRSATEVYDTTTAMGRLFITLVAALAQWERENLAERVKFGIEQMIDEGKRPGGHSPYGYKFDKFFNCTVIENEAKWVVKVFNWYIQGLGYRKIAKRLNDHNVPPRIAKKWTTASIYKLLHNDIYIGVYKWGTKTIVDNHPAIIDRTIYLQVKKKMEQKQTDRSRHGKFPFTGILTCGPCNGYPINGFIDKEKKKSIIDVLNVIV